MTETTAKFYTGADKPQILLATAQEILVEEVLAIENAQCVFARRKKDKKQSRYVVRKLVLVWQQEQ